MDDNAIQVKDIKKAYGKSTALNGVSLSVQKGRMAGLIGPDGAGKTTLIRILTSLLDPDEGECRLAGISVHKEPGRVRKIIGYMPQRFSLYPDLTVGENLRFFADLFQVSKKERLEKTKRLLEFSRLSPFVERRAGDLSGGMKQKLALSCALIHTPEILILDEPTTGVDPVSRREFWSILSSLKKEGVTILVTTPYMDEAARCDRISLIHHGHILGAGTAREIIESSAGSIVSLAGPDLLLLAKWFKKRLGTEQVRILGDRVQLNLFSFPEEGLPELIAQARSSGQKIDSVERGEPVLEDAFISLIEKKEKNNETALAS
jgi:ABC-2 type transport system ATP-binding protein